MVAISLDLIDPELVHDLVLMEPNYAKNRERAATLIYQGYALYDSFDRVRNFIFGASILTAVGSGYMWWRRGLRKKGVRVAEANVLYPTALVISSLLAWFSRPSWLRPSPPPEPTVAQQQAPIPTTVPAVEVERPNPLVNYLDTKAAEIKQYDPYFVNRTFGRLLANPSIKKYWDATPEQIQAFLHYDPKGVYRPT